MLPFDGESTPLTEVEWEYRLEEYLRTHPMAGGTPPSKLEESSDSWWSTFGLRIVTSCLAASLALTLSVAVWTQGYKGQDDLANQPSIAEEDYWNVNTPAYPSFTFLYNPDPEEIPAGSLLSFLGGPDEDYWAVQSPPYPQPINLVWKVEDEPAIVPLLEEDYWAVYTPRYPSSTDFIWAIEDDPPALGPSPFDEDYWNSFVPLDVRPVVSLWSTDEAFIPNPEEAYWFVPALTPPSPVLTLWTVEDDYVPSLAEEDYWTVSTPSYPQVVRDFWAVNDELPLWTVADEDYWWPFMLGGVPLVPVNIAYTYYNYVDSVIGVSLVSSVHIFRSRRR